MSLNLDSPIFTTQLTSDSLSLTEAMGIKRVSVYNGTAVIGTVLGSLSLGNIASTAIDIGEKETFTVDAVDASVIKQLVIVAPAGCTLKIVAQQ
jgi:hypothetical protein|tara:strand:+ start:138 stop:419 length:282 start_codon:yes stop_codon:yes gene_type:complete